MAKKKPRLAELRRKYVTIKGGIKGDFKSYNEDLDAARKSAQGDGNPKALHKVKTEWRRKQLVRIFIFVYDPEA